MPKRQSTINLKEINALVSLLDDEDQEVHSLIVEKIMSFGDGIFSFLESKKKEANSQKAKDDIEKILVEINFLYLKTELEKWLLNEENDLLKGLYLVAKLEDPSTELTQLKQEINLMYFDVWVQLKDNLHPHDMVSILNAVFFDKHKFYPDNNFSLSPNNWNIAKVLKYKNGNEVSLSVAYLLICQKLNLPIAALNLPDTFLLTFLIIKIQFYINVFNFGRIISLEDFDLYLEQKDLLHQTPFEVVSNKEIVRIFLNNLHEIYLNENEQEKANKVYDLLALF